MENSRDATSCSRLMPDTGVRESATKTARFLAWAYCENCVQPFPTQKNVGVTPWQAAGEVDSCDLFKNRLQGARNNQPVANFVYARVCLFFVATQPAKIFNRLRAQFSFVCRPNPLTCVEKGTRKRTIETTNPAWSISLLASHACSPAKNLAVRTREAAHRGYFFG